MHYNFHTHTFRCNHATGEDREYVKNAISGGITKMGFSDHIPFVFPDGHESHYRIQTKDINDYINSISSLKEEFKGKIELHMGFEMEYYPLYFDSMLENAINWGAEYLVLGQHYLGNEHPDGACSPSGSSSEAELCEYVDCVTEAMKTGVFSYVAHPDIFKFTGDSKIYEKHMRRLCIAAKELNIPIELNLLGIRTNRFYPTDYFWQIAGEEQPPVIFGHDAHAPEDAYDEQSLRLAENIVKKYNLNLLSEPALINIQRYNKK